MSAGEYLADRHKGIIMTINFISPNLLVAAVTAGIKASGFDIDFQAFCTDVEKGFNRPLAKRFMDRHYADLIPQDLAVCISSSQGEKDIMQKYGLPYMPQVAAGAVAMGLDSRHDLVLIVNEGYIHNEVLIKHELVHYRQIRRGDLKFTIEGDIHWRDKGGSVVTMNALDSMVKRNNLAFDQDELLYQELLKPWEIEAYATTSTPEILQEMSARCRRLISEYLETNQV